MNEDIDKIQNDIIDEFSTFNDWFEIYEYLIKLGKNLKPVEEKILTDDNVILVQMTSDTVQLVNAMPITTVEWDEFGGMTSNFKVMAIQVPWMRWDYNETSGVAHWS